MPFLAAFTSAGSAEKHAEASAKNSDASDCRTTEMSPGPDKRPPSSSWFLRHQLSTEGELEFTAWTIFVTEGVTTAVAIDFGKEGTIEAARKAPTLHAMASSRRGPDVSSLPSFFRSRGGQRCFSPIQRMRGPAEAARRCRYPFRQSGDNRCCSSYPVDLDARRAFVLPAAPACSLAGHPAI